MPQGLPFAFLAVVVCVLLGGVAWAWWIVHKKLAAEKTELKYFDGEKPSNATAAQAALRLPNTAESSKKSPSPQTGVYQIVHLAFDTGEVSDDPVPLAEQINFSRYLAGIAVFVGLLGTVVGVIFALSDLSGIANGATSTSASGYEALSGKINTLLSGISTSSFSTLFGILATLIISGRNTFYDQKCREIARDAAFIAREKYARFNQAEDAAQTLQKLLTEAKEMAEQITSQMGNVQMAQASVQATATLLSDTQTALDNSATSLQTVREAIEKAQDFFVSEIDLLKKAAEESGKNLKNQMSELAGQLQKEQKRLTEQNRTDLAAMLKTTREQLADSLTKNQEQLAKAAANTLIALTEKTAEAAKQIAEKLRDIETASTDTLQRELERGNTALETGSSLIEKLKSESEAALSTHRETQKEILADAVRANSDVANSAKRLEEASQSVRESSQTLHKTTQELVTKLEKSDDSRSADSKELQKMLKESGREVRTRLDNLLTSFENSLADLVATTQPTVLRDEVKHLHDDMRNLRSLLDRTLEMLQAAATRNEAPTPEDQPPTPVSTVKPRRKMGPGNQHRRPRSGETADSLGEIRESQNEGTELSDPLQPLPSAEETATSDTRSGEENMGEQR